MPIFFFFIIINDVKDNGSTACCRHGIVIKIKVNSTVLMEMIGCYQLSVSEFILKN